MQVRLDSIVIGYDEYGTSDGKPIIFIHGFPFNRSMWEPQVKALPKGFRAITVDIRGHGESEVGDGQYSIEFFVDDLIALLDHLKIDKAILCGLSMGGYIALRTIERHPERVRALVLSDTRSEADSNEGKIKRATSIKSVKTDGVKQFADTFVKAVFAAHTFEHAPHVIENIRKIIESTSPLSISGTLLALAARTDTTSYLQSIKVPTLILVGEHDILTPPSASEAMHQKISHSTFYIIPNAAHMSNLENPDFFNEKLFAFLSEIR